MFNIPYNTKALLQIWAHVTASTILLLWWEKISPSIALVPPTDSGVPIFEPSGEKEIGSNYRGVRKIGGKLTVFDWLGEVSFGSNYREFRKIESSRNRDSKPINGLGVLWRHWNLRILISSSGLPHKCDRAWAQECSHFDGLSCEVHFFWKTRHNKTRFKVRFC